MVELKEKKFEKLVRDLASIKGRHTELVTVYIPAGHNILKVAEQLRAEQSTAQNIKSKAVRKNVMAALEKILQHLRAYKKTPPKGLALFCGNISQKEGTSDIEIFPVEPLEELRTKLYQCDQRFCMDPLKQMMEEKEIYGLAVLDSSEADIGILKGKRVEGIKHMESIVPGKTKKGGWSASRFARVREGLLEDFLKNVGAAASTEFQKMKLMGVIIGGPGPIKDNFLEGGYLNYQVKKQVLGTVNTSYTGEYGLKEMVERSKDIISEASAIKESILLERFFTELAKDTGLGVYGKVSFKLLKKGIVDIFLVTDDYFNKNEKEMEEVLSEAENMGSKVEIISQHSPKGGQLQELGGVGAILRYKAV
ncbi:MAG: peptide chain release factor 1 [Candidatus Aenigmarchaeota archaeon]|nr:peptide chain release factor 1 [Candidatus Aenigmarchaeota archaeon]